MACITIPYSYRNAVLSVHDASVYGVASDCSDSSVDGVVSDARVFGDASVHIVSSNVSVFSVLQ